jgi:chemotaxis protein MotB
MFRQAIVVTVAAIISLSAFGCVSKSAFEMMEDEATRLGVEIEDLQNRHINLKDAKAEINSQKEILEQEQIVLLADSKRLKQEMADQQADYELQLKVDEEQIDDFGRKNNALHNEITQLRQEKELEVAKMSTTYEDLLTKMKSEIDKGQVTISELKGKLTVNLVDAILFASGKSEVKAEGMLVLQKVADILKSVTDKAIRIEGHTDNVKIGEVLARKYPTNWELSASRAVNVTRFLQAQGLNPEDLSAAAYGEYMPVADNETSEGRVQNRRIEIVLIAKNR